MASIPSFFDLGFYLLVYAFFGWVAELCYYIAVRRRFVNRGFTTLPLILSSGVTMVVLALVLPTLAGNHVLGFIGTLVIAAVVDDMFDWITRRMGSRLRWHTDRIRLFTGKPVDVMWSAVIAALYYVVYLMVHPVMMGLRLLIPAFVLKLIVIVGLVLVAVDFISVVFTVRTGLVGRIESGQMNYWQRFTARMAGRITKRLERAYPGIEHVSPEEEKSYVFAKGLCWDKLIWVFLICALLGDMIEMVFCRVTGGTWMSRSSVLYGPFSVVWGFGAVVLTVTLQRLAGKDDRHVFLAGFVIGGVYEYMCSVFTELVFGTVFWDYSHMPLNIGGRTNVLYCFFWGILSVVWIKMIYPRLSDFIEKVPAVAGKIITWYIIVLMLCDALLTGAVMIRYNLRPLMPEASNPVTQWIDAHYDDAFMEHRWPNMKRIDGPNMLTDDLIEADMTQDAQ